MRTFQYTTTLPRIFSGAQCLSQISRELERLQASRAVILCGSTLSRSDALDQVRSAMGERCAGIYDAVRAHSPLGAVEAAAHFLDQVNADAVVAVGGGSAVVTARAATILQAEKRDIHLLCSSTDQGGALISPRLLAAKMPQLVVPTTPSTAIAKAGSAVFDPATGERLALFDPKTRAQAIFVHPELLASAPPGLVITAGLDTITLAVEGLASRSGNPISDALLMHAVRLVATQLVSGAADLDLDARADLVLAATLCGQGTDSTGAGIATVLGHAIGPRCGVENGLVKAAVLASTLRFNSVALGEGLARIATALNIREVDADKRLLEVIRSLESLFERVGAPTRLRDVGLSRDDLSSISAHAMRDWFIRGNPRPVESQSQLQEVLEEAW